METRIERAKKKGIEITTVYSIVYSFLDMNSDCHVNVREFT